MTKQKFLKPEQALYEAGMKKGMVVADLGAGNGFFTIPAAKLVGETGRVWAVDILEEALGNLMSTARLEKCKNIRTQRCDLEHPADCEIPELACDFIIVGKILSQMSRPEVLIREAYRILKTGGTVLLIEWKREGMPIGPVLESRLDENKVEVFFSKQGFKYVRQFEPDNYHYCLVFQK